MMNDDDLSIPFAFDLNKNPDAAARRERERAAPFTPTTFTISQDAQRDRDAELAAFLAAEAERERIEKENSLAAFNAKKQAKTAVTLQGRFDSSANRWITPEQDLVEMAAKAHKPDGSAVTMDELRAAFAAPGATFGKQLLAQIDTGKLALEAEKMLERQRRRNKRKAMANAQAAKPRRRRVA